MSQPNASPGSLGELLRPGRTVRAARRGVFSVLPPSEEGAPYDARAAAYGRVVGNRLYNRLAWGASTAGYRAFAERAVASGTGPLLDAGSGSALFTAAAYARATRPIVLVDRSLGMLEAARDRLTAAAGGTLPGHVALLQADLRDLPFRKAGLGTVLSMGMLHLFEDAPSLARDLAALIRPGGVLFASSLVAERAVGRRYLKALHRAGEVATPRTFDALRTALTAALAQAPEVRRQGSMAFFTLQAAP